MRFNMSILISILFILSLVFTVQPQNFDLLKDYHQGKSILYHFNRTAFPTSFFPDTVTTITIFNGTYKTYIDSINFNVSDSINTYHLLIHQIGTETTRNAIRVISSRNIDTFYYASIKEFLNLNFGSGEHKISGFIFPDTVYQTPRCPMDTTIFYPYFNYYRFYHFPSADTFDIRNDTLLLTNISTDCFDAAYQVTLCITLNDGLLQRKNALFNFFDWSYTDYLIKGEVSDLTDNDPISTQFTLYQNYPNPFNPSTTISWQSPVSSWQTLKVYDVLGNEVSTLVDEYKPAGSYEVEFQSNVGSLQLASGVYYYQLKVGEFFQAKKMVLIR